MLNQTFRTTPRPVSPFSIFILALLIFGCAAMTQAQTDPIYSLEPATVGVEYDEKIEVTGGRAVKFEVVKGSLPPGIDLGQTTGRIFGSPTGIETKAYTFTLRVTDSAKKTADFQLEMVVEAGSLGLNLKVKEPGGTRGTQRAGARASTSRSGRSQSSSGTRQRAGDEDEKGEKEENDDDEEEDEAAAKPAVDSPLTEGAATVKGFMPAKDVKSVMVEVFPATADAAKLANAKPLRMHPATLAEGGRFTANVEAPLTRGQKVRVRAEMTDAKAKKLVSDAVTVERETRVQTRMLEGVKEIKGTADQKAGQVYAEARIDGVWRQIGVGSVNADTGVFTIPLENALTRQTGVRVYREGTTPAELAVESTTPPELRPSLLEGARSVSGYSKALSAKVEVQVLPEEGSSDSPLHQTQPTAVNPETGEFTVQVPGLSAGQRVRARVQNTETWSGLERVESPGDWGRVRGYFGIGMMLSKDNDQSFSRRDLFLNFNLDANWYHRPHYSTVPKESRQKDLVDRFVKGFTVDDTAKRLALASAGTPEQKAAVEANATAVDDEKRKLSDALERLNRATHLSDEERMATRHLLLEQSLERLAGNPLVSDDRKVLIGDILQGLSRARKKRWDVHLNTFFETRLTPVPVPGQNSAAGGVGGPAFDNFISSEKGALMQFGTYAPIFHHGAMTWNHQGSQNAVFFAPIGRVGVQTIFNREALADSAVFKDNDLFNFFAAGVRFGHYKLSGSDDRAPQLVSYLDITRGRWQNLERLVDTEETDSAGEPIFVRRRPFRWALEGRLKIPSLPFLIGFDSNIGEGPDDLRFIFGTNFDIAQLFKLLN